VENSDDDDTLSLISGAAAMTAFFALRGAYAQSLPNGLGESVDDLGGVGDLGDLGGSLGGSSLSTGEITDGLKETLRFASDRAVVDVSALDGFNADPDIHIPLPESPGTVQSALQTVGMSDMADELETKINRAAEGSATQAASIFWGAVDGMSVENADGILNGPDGAATQYFRRETSVDLKNAMRPVVDESLADVGAVQAYDNMMGEYESIPFMPDAKADLTNYALDGLFVFVARKEVAIRNDPVKRSTELLQTVFG